MTEPYETEPVHIPLREELRVFFEKLEALRREYADGISVYNQKRAQRAVEGSEDGKDARRRFRGGSDT